MKKIKTYQKFLFGGFIIAAILSSIHATSFSDWMLEIAPAFIGLTGLYIVGRRYSLSPVSYGMIVILLVLVVFQAHYGVAKVPIGFTIGKWMHTERNMFDRLTHFSFGFLLLYPVYQLIRKSLKSKRFSGYFFSGMILMGVGAIYEIIEYLVHLIASHRLSTLFVAAQADFWDTSEDLAMEFCGILLALVGVVVWRMVRKSVKK